MPPAAAGGRRSAGASLVGLDDFRRDLRAVDKKLGKVVALANKKVSEHVVRLSQGKARSAFGKHASQAAGIRPSGTQRRAQVVLRTAKYERLFAAEFGSTIHMVPRGRPDQNVPGPRMKPIPQNKMHRRVFRPWSGNQWTPGENGGPKAGVGYAVHPTIRRELDNGNVPRMFLDALPAAFVDAFPERDG